MHAYPSNKYLLELGARSLRKIIGVQAFGQDGLSFFVDEFLALEYLSKLPALIAIETKD